MRSPPRGSSPRDDCPSHRFSPGPPARLHQESYRCLSPYQRKNERRRSSWFVHFAFGPRGSTVSGRQTRSRPSLIGLPESDLPSINVRTDVNELITECVENRLILGSSSRLSRNFIRSGFGPNTRQMATYPRPLKSTDSNMSRSFQLVGWKG